MKLDSLGKKTVLEIKADLFSVPSKLYRVLVAFYFLNHLDTLFREI